MATNQNNTAQNYQVNAFTKGMNTDTSYDMLNSEQYVFGQNIRITNNTLLDNNFDANSLENIVAPVLKGDNTAIIGDMVGDSILAVNTIGNVGAVITKTKQSGAYDRWITTHSCVYDINNKTVNVVSQENKNSEYNIQMNDEWNGYEQLGKCLYKVDYDETQMLNNYTWASNYLKNDQSTSNFGCSAITVRTNNNTYFGRNLDWFDNKRFDFIIHTDSKANSNIINPQESTYEVLGVAAIDGLEPANVGDYSNEKFRLLPFYLQDGINSAGVFCCVNVVHRHEGETPGGDQAAKTWCTTMLPRLILDNFGTARSAVDYLCSDEIKRTIFLPNRLTNLDYSVHFMVGDDTQTYVLEFVSDGVRWYIQQITNNEIMTNFRLDGVYFKPNGDVYTNLDADLPTTKGVYAYDAGLERYNILNHGKSSVTDIRTLRDLMNSILYSKFYNSNPIWYSELSDPQLGITVDTAPNDPVMLEVIAALPLINSSGEWRVYRVDLENGQIKATLKFQYGITNKDRFSTVINKELEDHLKLYIADGEHEIMCLDLDGEGVIESIDDMISNHIQPTKPVIIKQKISGQLKTQQLQYTYRFYKKYGISSKIAPMTPKIQVIDSNRNKEIGNAEDTVTSLGFKISIDKSDPEFNQFDHVQIFRLSYIIPNNPPEVNLIYDGEITGSEFSLNDTGIKSLAQYTIEEFNALYSSIIIPQVIEQNQNYLFAANVKDETLMQIDETMYDARAFRLDSNGQARIYTADDQYEDFSQSDIENGIDSSYYIQLYSDINNPREDSYKYDNEGLLGGIGKNISWRFITGDILLDTNGSNSDNIAINHEYDEPFLWYIKDSIQYGSDKEIGDVLLEKGIQCEYKQEYEDPIISSIFRSLGRDEVYRYGIIFYDKYGVRSNVLWIADIRTPNESEFSCKYYGGSNVISARPLGIEFTVKKPTIEGHDIIGYQIVRCQKTLEYSKNLLQCALSRPLHQGKYDKSMSTHSTRAEQLGDVVMYATVPSEGRYSLQQMKNLGFDDTHLNLIKRGYINRIKDNAVTYYIIHVESGRLSFTLSLVPPNEVSTENVFRRISLQPNGTGYLVEIINSSQVQEELDRGNELLQDNDINTYRTPYYPNLFLSTQFFYITYGVNNADCGWSGSEEGQSNIIYNTDGNLWSTAIDEGAYFDYGCTNTENNKLYQIFAPEILYKRRDELDRLSSSNISIVPLTYQTGTKNDLTLAQIIAGNQDLTQDGTGSVSNYLNEFALRQDYASEENGGIPKLFTSSSVSSVWTSSLDEQAPGFIHKLSQYVYLMPKYQQIWYKNDKADANIVNKMYSPIYEDYCKYVDQFNSLQQVTFDPIEIKNIADVQNPKWEEGFSNVTLSGSDITGAIKQYKGFTTNIGEFTYLNWVCNGMYNLAATKNEAQNQLGNRQENRRVFTQSNDSHAIDDDYRTRNRQAYGWIGPGPVCFVAELEAPIESSILSNHVIGQDRELINMGSVISNICHIAVQFAGVTKEEKQYDVYYGFANYGWFESDNASVCVFDGNKYITPVEFTNMFKTYDFNDIESSLVSGQVVYYVPLESTVNTYFDYGMNYRNTSNNNLQLEPGVIDGIKSQERPLHQYNQIYSDNDSSIDVFNAQTLELVPTEYPQRIYYSQLKLNGENIDSWQIYKPADMIDADTRYGDITNLLTSHDVLYFWQDKAFGKLSVNERSLVTDNNNNTVQLGQGGVLQRTDYISTRYGMRNQDFSAISAEDGIFWIDINNNAIVAANNQAINYGEMMQVQNLINRDIFKDTKNRPTIDYDLQNQELLCKLFKDSQLVFNLKLKAATSIYTREYERILDFNNTLFGLNLTGNGYTATQYNNLRNTGDMLSPTKLQFVVNSVQSVTKVFDNQKLVVVNKNENTQFDKLYSFTTDISSVSNINITDLNYVTDREGNLEYAIPRLNNEDWGNRIRGKWMKVDITDDNPSYDFAISHIITKFRQSYS